MDTVILKDIKENVLKYTVRCRTQQMNSEDWSQLPDIVLMQARVAGLMQGFHSFGMSFTFSWREEMKKYERETGKTFPTSYTEYYEWAEPNTKISPYWTMNVFNGPWLIYQTKRRPPGVVVVAAEEEREGEEEGFHPI